MSNPFEEAAKKGVYYPDELDSLGTVQLVSEAPIPADDVPADDARYGDWVKVSQNGSEMWLACPRDLARALGEGDASPGHVFQVRESHREDAEDAPWQFKVAHDPEQH